MDYINHRYINHYYINNRSNMYITPRYISTSKVSRYDLLRVIITEDDSSSDEDYSEDNDPISDWASRFADLIENNE